MDILGDMMKGSIRVVGGGSFESVLLVWGYDEDNAMITEEEYMARSKHYFCWNKNKLAHTIEGFYLPDMSLRMMITHWNSGNKE